MISVTSFDVYESAIRGSASARGWSSWYDAHDTREELASAWAALWPYLRGRIPYTDDGQELDYEIENTLHEVNDRLAKSGVIDALLASSTWREVVRSLTEGGTTGTSGTLTHAGTETRASGGSDVVSETGTETANETRYTNGVNVVSLTADGTASEHTEAERGFDGRQTETAHGRTDTLSFDGRTDTTAETITHGRTEADTETTTDNGARIEALIRSYSYDVHDYLRATARGLSCGYLGGLKL